MFWTDVFFFFLKRCFGLMVGLRDVWGWWVDQEIF